jgi:hypothetical protein
MFSHIRKCGAAFVVAAATLLGALTPSYADNGSVTITVTKAGFIIGVGGGSGVLHFKGKNYRLKVGGLSAGTIGFAQAQLVGVARHLRLPEDIAGSYSAVSVGFAVAGGGKTARLQNANGVVLELQGKQVGFELSFNLSGLTISVE